MHDGARVERRAAAAVDISNDIDEKPDDSSFAIALGSDAWRIASSFAPRAVSGAPNADGSAPLIESESPPSVFVYDCSVHFRLPAPPPPSLAEERMLCSLRTDWVSVSGGSRAAVAVRVRVPVSSLVASAAAPPPRRAERSRSASTRALWRASAIS